MEKYCVNSDYIVEDLAGGLLKRLKNDANNIIILCVGSDRIVTDLLGPLVATELKRAGVKCFVYGSLEYTINALNLRQTVNFIKTMHKNSKILIIDSAEGEELNQIGIKDGGINFYSLPDLFVGDCSILAYNMKRENNSIKLNQMGYCKIEFQAKIITNSIIKFFNYAN